MKSSTKAFLFIKHYKLIVLLFLLISLSIYGYSQNGISNPAFNESRLRSVVIVESAVSTVAMTGLYYLWYKKFPHSRFHLFNDNSEWLNMDKAGHATTAYNICNIQYNAMQWCGLNNNRSAWISGLTAMGIQTIIEIFDGFSQKWGFSKGDMLANLVGTSLFMVQQFAWNEQRVQLKFSFHHTIFPQYNPNELGKNVWQRWLKDYNGQTYWLSINPYSFMNSKTSFPRWLNFAMGYGAEGMTGATINPREVDNKVIPEFKRYRQYYFSFDANMKNIFSASNSPLFLISIANIIKLPAPAIEFSQGKAWKFHPFYF